MTNKTHLTRCATLAIAATLALGSTPLLAQEIAAPPVTTAPPPTIVVPDVAPVPAPAPAPTIVLPDEVTQPEAEVAQPEAAAPAEPTRATPPPATATRATRAPAERPAQAAAAPEPAPVAEVPTETAITDAPTFVPPIAAEPAPELAPTPAETRTVDNTMAVVLGILAALALIVIGFFALRRKGSKRYAAAEPRIERPMSAPVPDRAEPLPEAIAAPEFPAGLEPEMVVAESGPSVSYTGAPFGAASAARPAGGLSHSGASVALPREMPKTYEEREALMRRMVDAAPDRANPFRSRGARTRRARLILASLSRDFKDIDPWIDLGQYSSNWPQLARRQSVAA